MAARTQTNGLWKTCQRAKRRRVSSSVAARRRRMTRSASTRQASPQRAAGWRPARADRPLDRRRAFRRTRELAEDEARRARAGSLRPGRGPARSPRSGGRAGPGPSSRPAPAQLGGPLLDRLPVHLDAPHASSGSSDVEVAPDETRGDDEEHRPVGDGDDAVELERGVERDEDRPDDAAEDVHLEPGLQAAGVGEELAGACARRRRASRRTS